MRTTYSLHLCGNCRTGQFHYFKPGRGFIWEICPMCGERTKIYTGVNGFWSNRRIARMWNKQLLGTYRPLAQLVRAAGS